MTTTTERTAGLDYAKLAERFNTIQADMIHVEDSELRGAEFTAEALRRLLAHVGQPGSGFVTDEEHFRVLDANRVVDRMNGKRAQEELREAREKFAATLADARHVIADAVRARVNERTVPSALRREGVLLAADWIDPK